MIDEYQRAHERLLSSLPVRTHPAKELPQKKLGRPPGDDIKPYRLPDETVRKMHALAASNPEMTRVEIAAECGVSPVTVRKYLGVAYPNLGPRRRK